MPDVKARIEFLARLDKYRTERPYVILLGEDEDSDGEIPTSNLEFDVVPEIKLRDMRELTELNFDQCAFEYVTHHQSEVTGFKTPADVALYAAETQSLLKTRFDAVQVRTYEVKLRQNVFFDRQAYDLNDLLAVEGPAIGAHNDVTINSAQKIIKKHLSKEEQRLYLGPDRRYRLRIINTWRPLNLVLEDRPLALCDSRTVKAEDLEVTDRVLPDRVAEIYYLHHNSQQQWYWLENQKSTEPFIFLMFDTMTRQNGARCESNCVLPYAPMSRSTIHENQPKLDHVLLWKRDPLSSQGYHEGRSELVGGFHCKRAVIIENILRAR